MDRFWINFESGLKWDYERQIFRFWPLMFSPSDDMGRLYSWVRSGNKYWKVHLRMLSLDMILSDQVEM